MAEQFNSKGSQSEGDYQREGERQSGTPVEVVREIAGKYPEMSWLTGRVNATPEASHTAEAGKTLGEQIFPGMEKKQVTEFDRTAVGLLTMHWVVKGDYESFIACQKPDVRLTRESFDRLRTYTLGILKTPEDFEAMETFMVINDLGKIKSVIEDLAERAQVEDVDHDKILLVGLEKHPDISPSFSQLSKKHKEMILNGLRTKFNIGQFIQGENIPASLEGLKNIDADSLKFYLLHALYDIAGAAGQAVQNGSMVMNESTHQNFESAIAALEKVSQGASLVEVYDQYLGGKAEQFGFDMAQPADRAVTRICCMLRVASKEVAQNVKQIFETLPKNTKAILESDLNKNGVDDGYATLVYYAPALLVNLQKKFGEKDPATALDNALRLGLKAMARVFQEARIATKKRTGNGVFTVMADSMAKAASENPDLLEQPMELRAVGDDAEVKFQPPVDIDLTQFKKLEDLAQLPGHKVALIGIGGGSDCVQAAMVSKLFTAAGKECPCVISIRSNKTGSQSMTGEMGEQRLVENHGGEIFAGVYLMKPDTTGSGRFVENVPAADIPTYLIVETQGVSTTEQINAVLAQVGGVDTVVGVDTGGDALFGTSTDEVARSTPDQDLRSLKAIAQLSGVTKLTCEVAVGVDSPIDAEAILQKANASYFEPTAEQSAQILNQYQQWEFDGSVEGKYGKTALAWQDSLKGAQGMHELQLPTSVVLDAANPWNPYVRLQPATKGLFVADLESHLQAIS